MPLDVAGTTSSSAMPLAIAAAENCSSIVRRNADGSTGTLASSTRAASTFSRSSS